MKPRMEIGGRYNWRGQSERLIYLGRNWSGNGYWQQFALVSEPDVVWCEVTDEDLHSFEVSKQEIEICRAGTAPERGLDKHSDLSPRQQRKARKAANRAAAQQTQGGE